MSCFRTCWSNSFDEPRKKGAFEAYHYDEYRGRNINTHSRGYIPWVWSRQFHHTYQLGKVLGQGAYAVVHEATKMTTEVQSYAYAVKVIQRNRLTAQDLRHFNDEVQILLDLQHESIIQLHELYKTPDFFFVVMEKLDGGELFDRLCEKDFYKEIEARDVCRTIFEATAYCHEQKVAHRDLKPENLLLISPNDDSLLKIADFGFAKRVARPNSLRTWCGSPAFTAPEIVFRKPYDERVDNWSLGVIVFSILGGYNPFQEDTIHLTFQQIRQANYQFDSENWDGISRDAKNLIKGLLTRDPDKRISAQEALSHPWMTGRGDDILEQNYVNLQRFKKFNAERKRDSNEPVRSASMYWLVTRR